MIEGELAVAQTSALNKTRAELKIVNQQLLKEKRKIVPDQFDVDEYEREIQHSGSAAQTVGIIITIFIPLPYLIDKVLLRYDVQSKLYEC
jgi:hypothetical protein